jgi:hypothetical protein
MIILLFTHKAESLKVSQNCIRTEKRCMANYQAVAKKNLGKLLIKKEEGNVFEMLWLQVEC